MKCINIYVYKQLKRKVGKSRIDMLKMITKQKHNCIGNFCIPFLMENLSLLSGSVFKKIMLSFYHAKFTDFS